jgi:hypothetical protein
MGTGTFDASGWCEPSPDWPRKESRGSGLRHRGDLAVHADRLWRLTVTFVWRSAQPLVNQINSSNGEASSRGLFEPSGASIDQGLCDTMYYSISSAHIRPTPPRVLQHVADRSSSRNDPHQACSSHRYRLPPETPLRDDPSLARPSPKLAPLTADSPEWMHNLHRDGVSGNRVGVLWKSLCLAT